MDLLNLKIMEGIGSILRLYLKDGKGYNVEKIIRRVIKVKKS